MRATTPTLLSIAEWREVINLHPYYLAQIGNDVPARSRGDCQGATFQWAWQDSEHLAREEIAQCIADAEELFRDKIGYYPAPKFITNEPQDYPRHYQADLYQGWGTPRGQYKSIKVNNGYVQNVGTELLTELDASIAVTLVDNDGDTIKESFNVTVPGLPSGTSASEIALFFTAVDRDDLPLSEWEIRPLRVSITGDTATIKGESVLLVKPNNQIGLDPEILSAAVASEGDTFVSEVAVYRRTVNTAETGALIWEYPGGCDNPPCEAVMSTGCFGVRNKELGWLAPRPAIYDTELAAFTVSYPDLCRAPDRVTVNYLAGYPRQANGKMDNLHARIISLLAAARLPNKTCGCGRADQRLTYYQSLPSDGEQKVYFNDMGGFGRKQGELEAWALAAPLSQGVIAAHGG